MKAREEAFEIVAEKEDDAIKGLEEILEKTKAKIATRRQAKRNLTQEYETEIAEMKRNVDYCDDSLISDMTAQLEQLTTTMETLRMALNKSADIAAACKCHAAI